MSDNDSIFEALAVLAKQCRDLEARLTHQEAINGEHQERLSAQAMMIERLRRTPGIPSPHPMWRVPA